jgi:hypothetical protein
MTENPFEHLYYSFKYKEFYSNNPSTVCYSTWMHDKPVGTKASKSKIIVTVVTGGKKVRINHLRLKHWWITGLWQY